MSVLAVMVLLGACGSSKHTATTATTTPSATAPSGATATTAAPATGTPITIGAGCPETPPVVSPECWTVTQAVVAQVNKEGGINGHPLKFTYCDTSSGNPQLFPQCIKELTDNSAVVAMVGGVSDGSYCSQITAAGMANIGPNVRVTDDFNCANSFPISDFSLSGFAAEAAYLFAAGKTKPGVIYPDIPAGLVSVKGIVSGFPSGTHVDEIAASLSEATYAPFIAKAEGDGDNPMFLLLSDTQLASAIKSAQQISYSPSFAVSYSCDDPKLFLTPLGSTINGVICALPWNPSAQTEITAVMDANGTPDFDNNFNAVAAYTGAEMAVAAMKSITGPVTRASLLSAMNHLQFSDPLLLAPINFPSLPGNVTGATRVPNALNDIAEVENGQLQVIKTDVNGATPSS